MGLSPSGCDVGGNPAHTEVFAFERKVRFKLRVNSKLSLFFEGGRLMVRRVLILHDVDSSPRSYMHLFAGFELRQLDWKTCRFEQVREYHADLIAPIAVDGGAWLMELLRSLRKKPIAVPVFPILSTEANSSLLALVSEVAADFAVWPAEPEEVLQRVMRIIGHASHEIDSVWDRLTQAIGLARLVGTDPAFQKLIAKIPLVARSNSPVLITGETGTGKELCARAIHHLSRRRDFPFIAVDCGAFPDQLFDNEMFGHARGAFTDAHRDQRGLIAMAEGGTLFLDEIDSLSQSSQAKLLRFLQERTYRPLGADKFVCAQVNVLAASNRDLEKMVSEHRFRSDLFFRLNVLRLHMIPLRERRGDIPTLARHFLGTICAEQGQPPKSLATLTIAELTRASWPGNVRELYNVMHRAVVFAQGAEILPADIAPPDVESYRSDQALQVDGFRQARARAIEAFERSYVVDALKRHRGNVTQSAHYAHQDRRAFGRLVKRYGIDRNSL
jgi:DNA-binding NtrC family response regulator